MELNLLLKMYDYYCNLFIEGKICLEMFQEVENEYVKRSKLFTINLN
jgi:hypothetical protein